MNRSLVKALLIVIATIGLISSCSKDTVFNKFQPIKDKIWEKQEEYYFAFNIKDNSIPYDVSIQLRNSDIYEYQNLWIFCEEQQPNQIIVKDTIECMLADDFGKWTGNGITLFQNKYYLHKKYFFPDSGQYIIGVRQGMRDNKLKGIEDIGLFVEKAAQ